MRTRSQARKRRQQQVRQTSVESPNLEKPNNNQETFNPPIVTMADNRTMAQLLEAPTEGYEDAIVVPEITANNFEIKHGLLNLVQNKQFFGHDKEDPHAHIRYFNKITSTMKFPNVPSTSVKLMLFPFSLEGAARIWLEKEPPQSILTWDDLRLYFSSRRHLSSAPVPLKAVVQVVLLRMVPFLIVIVRLPIATITEITSKITSRKLSASKFPTKDNSGSRPHTMANQSDPPDFPTMQPKRQAQSRQSLEPQNPKKPWQMATTELDECLALADLGASINLMPLSVFEKLNLQSLTKTRMILELGRPYESPLHGIAKMFSVKALEPLLSSDFMLIPLLPHPSLHSKGSDFILEEIEAELSDTSYKSGIDDAECDPENDILLLEVILNSEPSSPLPNHADYFPEVKKELKICEAKTDETSIDEPPEVELKDSTSTT
ncbi:hypothetical protein Tco_0874207 [Tanacetum coccineum]|uniref:Reverse transcriptase domain-containing protein n=1 Tax=Tanacetum coccineum TaxID=301880 RepID=A0ABQ5BL02_9ASTR